MDLVFWENPTGNLPISVLPNGKKVLMDKSQDLAGFQYGRRQHVTVVKDLDTVAFVVLGDKGTNQTGRHTEQYRMWRDLVINACGGQCVICGRDSSICHHVKRWSKYPDLRYEPSNGVVLCKRHHALVDLLFLNRWQIRLVAWLYHLKGEQK